MLGIVPDVSGLSRDWGRRLAALLLVCACAARPGTIGAILVREDTGRTYIRDVPSHLAAYRAGLRRGDELLFVEGRQVSSLTDAELHRLLAGAVDDEVQLTLVRDGATILRVSLARTPAEPYRATPLDQQGNR